MLEIHNSKNLLTTATQLQRDAFTNLHLNESILVKKDSLGQGIKHKRVATECKHWLPVFLLHDKMKAFPV